MKEEANKDYFKPLFSEIDILYAKYRFLCSVDYDKFNNHNMSEKELFNFIINYCKSLEEDFESVMHEAKMLDQCIDKLR